MVTVIADNYFGYCKKEVKTQISYASNLFGNCEEEHAGGALAFPSYVLGYEFLAGSNENSTVLLKQADFDSAMTLLGDRAERMPQGYAVDRSYPDVYYIPYGAAFSVREGNVTWQLKDGSAFSLPLRPGSEYLLPAGYRVKLEKQTGGNRWRLIGIRAEGVFCHKPCTVSGGGKSEISKSILGAIVKGPIFVKEYHADSERVAKILKMDTGSVFKQTPPPGDRKHRPILSPERSLGSVIKLLTPSPDYKDEYNQWLKELPQTIRQYVCLVKRYYRPEWGDNWREHFTVDQVNGYLGHELKYENLKVLGNYLRIGFEPDGSWRVYKLRPDFNAAAKVQLEDDITVSVTVPRQTVPYLDDRIRAGSVKLLQNCEAMLFQRPDDAIHRGIDEQAEADVASPGTFLSNFEPLTGQQARAIVNRVLDFDSFSDPMRQLILNFVDAPCTEWLVSSAHPRLVDGVPTKNPRYLQKRPDLVNARDTYVAEVAMRLYRGAPAGSPLFSPVNAVLAGRRGNPPDRKQGIPPLAVYGPIHYQDLPELFMDFIASLTGKSPSTTGFGSEGALTKGPFNALPPVIDVNNALVACILNEHAGFTTAAGYMGPKYRCDHDISMLVPELWCRMSQEERDPAFLIANGYLQPVNDFQYEGRTVLGSRLGYRITNLFADRFLGRIFETPNAVLTQEILQPELQDLETYVTGIDAIAETQARVALQYFEDGSVEAACPPVKALLHIMAHGHYQGMSADNPTIRAMFTRESLLASDWYQQRLQAKQQRDIALWQRHVRDLEAFQTNGAKHSVPPGFALEQRLAYARQVLAQVSSEAYLQSLNGMLGADPAMGRTK
ncbi:MAG: hypothetical protein MUF01_07690 [Bryobacterales bacterium]|nr:hypothetical protein [Bryobacterales bacterium]